MLPLATTSHELNHPLRILLRTTVHSYFPFFFRGLPFAVFGWLVFLPPPDLNGAAFLPLNGIRRSPFLAQRGLVDAAHGPTQSKL